MSTRLPQLINGEFQQSRTDTWIPVTNPATQEVLCEVPAATAEEMESAIQSAREAFLEWRETPVSERARVVLRGLDDQVRAGDPPAIGGGWRSKLRLAE